MTLRIGLKHIRCFDAIVKTGSFSEAARLLHTVQPALSKYIKELEDILSTRLICRDTRPIRLTLAGESFKNHAANLLQYLDKAIQEIQSISKGYNSVLRIARSDDVNFVTLSDFLSEFRECCPEIEIKFISVDYESQLSGIKTGAFDAGFCRYPAEDPQLITTQIYHEDLVAVLPKHHPLSNYPGIKLEQFLCEPLIFYHPEEIKGSYKQVLNKISRTKAQLNIVQSANSFEFMLSLVAAGFGISLMGSSRVPMSRHANIVIRPFAQPITLETYLVYPMEGSNALKRFIWKTSSLKVA